MTQAFNVLFDWRAAIRRGILGYDADLLWRED